MAGSLTLHILRFLPKNLISRLFGRLAGATRPRWFARGFRDRFAAHFGIDLSLAEKPVEDYPCLLALFTRRLKPGVRPIAVEEGILVSPVDGKVGASGRIADGRLVQAKGIDYTIAALLGDAALAPRFANGSFMTIYLSPRDYHRIHSPVAGRITRTLYESGTLWPVNPPAVRTIPSLFAVNERVTPIIESPGLTTAVAMVGATNVGSIRLLYHDFVTNLGGRRGDVPHPVCEVARGGELGVFQLGSTVVLLTDVPVTFDSAASEGAWLPMGSVLGRLDPNLA